MAKFKLDFYHNGSFNTTVGIYSKKEDAVKAGGKYRIGDYCLDKEEYRTIGLAERDYCVLGCGNDELRIEEIND